MDIGFTGQKARNTRHEAEFCPPARVVCHAGGGCQPPRLAWKLAVLEQRREKPRALKQAMMQELLTGRARLV